MPAPSATLRRPKTKDFERTLKPKAKTPKDWDEQEKGDRDARAPQGMFPDMVDDAVGSNFRLVPYGPDRFRDRAGRKFQVSRFYPHQNIAFDTPMTQAEADLKKEALQKMGAGYVYFLPNAPKLPDVIEREIREALALCKKHSKP